jgi:hypothetical protein
MGWACSWNGVDVDAYKSCSEMRDGKYCWRVCVGLQWIRTGANMAVLRAVTWPLVATKCRQCQSRAVSQQFRQIPAASCCCGQHPGSAVAPDNPRSGSAAGYRSTFTGFPATQLQTQSLHWHCVSHSYGIFPSHSFLSQSAAYSCFQFHSRRHVYSRNDVITLGRSTARADFRDKH